jgi:hypothetical protein
VPRAKTSNQSASPAAKPVDAKDKKVLHHL